MTAFRRITPFGLCLLATAAAAQTQVGNAQMLGVSGTCSELIVGELDLSKACSQKLLNVTYPDGRVGFYFVLDDSRIITFTGMDGDNPTPDTDVINLDKVIVSRKDTPDQPDVFPATGTCGFGNPMKGSATIACEGTLSDGKRFSATFTTDGKPPT